MPDAFEEQAVLVAAEQAAAEGDTTAAELHLRKLLDLQIARLGPDHAEVASTLHNLAVVCERASRISEAEGLYRRAAAVAASSLPPTDQLVIRCQEDLNAFLDARMTPLKPPPTPAAPTATPAPRPTPPSGVRAPAPAGTARAPARPASRVRPPTALPPPPPPARTGWVVAAIAGAVVVVAAAAAWLFVGRDRETPPPASTVATASPTPARRPPAAPPKKPAATAPVAAAAPAAAPSEALAQAPAAQEPAAPRQEPPAADAEPAAPEPAASTPEPENPPPAESADGITVTDARLCAELSTAGAWTCVAPDLPFAGGRLHFLTRLDVPSTTQIEHRWLYGGEIVQVVRLRVQASGRPGYRTYSRQTIDPARSGDWRVELRGPDGAVLAEERFVVR
ncbi:MAG: DUF2914 domain-containing protein [Vicinamibacterales bacterium]